MVLPAEIVNGTIRIIQQSDSTTTYLVYATWSLVCATIFIGYLTIRLSRIQHETLHRPWLVLDKAGRIVDNVSLSLENIGNLPAEKIIVSCKYVFTKQDQKKISSDSENIKIGIIVPKQKYYFTFNFLEIDEIQTCLDMTADIFVKYYFGKKEKISMFTYVIDNLVDLDHITCEKAT